MLTWKYLWVLFQTLRSSSFIAYFIGHVLFVFIAAQTKSVCVTDVTSKGLCSDIKPPNIMRNLMTYLIMFALKLENNIECLGNILK